MLTRMTSSGLLIAGLCMTAVPTRGIAASDTAGTTKQHQHSANMPKNMMELMKMDPKHCMEMMDQAHKGFVTKEEFMRFQEQLWSNMDKNNDNKVDKPEFGIVGGEG